MVMFPVFHIFLLFANCRLVNGLASEKVRWGESVLKMKLDEKTLPGDILLTSSYLSYVGCFNRIYRTNLLEEKWLPFLKSLQVLLLLSVYQ